MSLEIPILRGAVGSGRDLSAFRVRSFDPTDYVAVYESQADEPWGFQIADPMAAGRAYRALGPCFTGWFHVEHSQPVPLGCAGLANMGHGLCEAWTLLSPVLRADRPARRWYKQQIRQRIPILMGEHGFQRAEANVGAGGLGFARSLGFTFESVMPRWLASGETFFKYVRFHPVQWDEVG